MNRTILTPSSYFTVVRFAILLLMAVNDNGGTLFAQQPVVVTDSVSAAKVAVVQQATAEAGAVRPADGTPKPPAEAAKPKGEPGKPGEVQPTDGKPSDGKPSDGKPSDGKPQPGKEPEANKSVQRTSEPPEPPNPDELKVRPNAAGMVEFQFRNQPWPKLLSWLADVSKHSLDWQELPADYLNLATQRPYTIEETRDAINRHLLMRGFTLLESEGVLSVVKVAAINPSMVPRISPSELTNQMPHRFVRTSFELYYLMASDVVEEFKSMLSPNGKITPLVATNRLEVMDCAGNLLDIHRVLEDEQSVQAMENLAREFPLKHARASYVKEQLEVFLGLKKSSASSSGGREMMESMQQQMQQQMQQMQQQMQQNRGSQPEKRVPGKEEIFLVANERSNSVIVHAPQNKMAIVTSFIARMDVPNESASDFERMGIRMKVFRLASLAPSELAKSLLAMDILEPATRLQVDENNSAIIAYASIADQYMIQSVIDRLDGSQRSAHVLQLRRLDAEAVSGSIKFLMGAEEESKDENRRFSYYDFGYSSRSSNKKPDKMRVGANVQDNQVLIWANAIEMEEVQGLLVKLGELPPPGGRQSTVRVIDASRQPETFEYLKRLKEQWERVSPNPLILPGEQEFEIPEESPSKKREEKAPTAKDITQETLSLEDFEKLVNTALSAHPDEKSDAAKPEEATRDATEDSHAGPDAVDELQRAAPSEAAQGVERRTLPKLGSRITDERIRMEGAKATVGNSSNNGSLTSQAPVTIMVDESGQLIIQSTDTAALDRLEEIMQMNKPPRRPYDVFVVKYARATWVKLNLDEYFEKEKKDDGRDRFYSWIYDMPSPKKESRQLGQKTELRFIADNDTNSIVAIGADDLHRQTIKELIELWDVPDPVNGKDVRYTKLVRINYSSAESIVATIKEAYRDLLSSNDSAFQANNGGGKNNGESKRNTNSETVQADGGLSSNFKGELSLGADVITNSVLVSARGEPLLELVVDMITELDKAAQPEGNVEILQVSPGMAGGSMGKALRAMLEKQQRSQKGKPNGNQDGAQFEQSNGPQNGRPNGRD